MSTHPMVNILLSQLLVGFGGWVHFMNGLLKIIFWSKNYFLMIVGRSHFGSVRRPEICGRLYLGSCTGWRFHLDVIFREIGEEAF